MVNYNKLSDFEINKRVAKTLNKYTPLNYPHEANKRSVGSLCSNDNYRWYDYCNNPADAWSIIVENKIDINWGDDVHTELKGAVIASRGKISATHENALRAAMIVFLMMQENK